MKTCFGSLIVLVITLGQSPSGTLRGRVVDDIARQPVAHAQIELNGQGLPQSRFVSTDERGNFTVAGLPSGAYRVMIEKPEYFTKTENVTWTAGSNSTLNDLVLVAKRRISGSVRWLDGEPAVGAVVGILVESDSDGLTPLRNGSARTNDDGEFRIQELQPGRYRLYALPPYRTDRDNDGRIVNSLARPALPLVSGSVDLRESIEPRLQSFRLEERPNTSVSGVVNISPSLPQGTIVSIQLLLRDNPAPFSFSTSARAGERFQLTSIPPAVYTLLASADVQGTRLYDAQTISVFYAQFGASGLSVTLRDSESIGGIVEISGKAAPAGIALQARPKHLPSVGTAIARTNAQGEFQFRGTIPGEIYDLTVSAPAETHVEQVIQENQGSTKSPFPITAGSIIRVLLAGSRSR